MGSKIVSVLTGGLSEVVSGGSDPIAALATSGISEVVGSSTLTNIAGGGLDKVLRGEDPVKSILGASSDLASLGLFEQGSVGGVLFQSILDPLGALVLGGMAVQEKLSAPDDIQAGVSAQVPSLGTSLDPNARRALLARQFGEEDPSRRKKKKKKTTKKSQFKRERTDSTSGIKAETKTTGLQL